MFIQLKCYATLWISLCASVGHTPQTGQYRGLEAINGFFARERALCETANVKRKTSSTSLKAPFCAAFSALHLPPETVGLTVDNVGKTERSPGGPGL